MKLITILAIVLPFHCAQAAFFRGSQVSVRAPLNDRRSYEYTTFNNGLKVLAVHDPKASKSGFAVAVSAGSFYDPVELPGLAHFCEHLLFLGTKKYPDEASFDTFLSMHDGENNAFTEQERTVFYNEISHAGFDEGMDRFAQFFISPLFKQELVGRELQAVNSEHLKNVPDQGRRLWELMRSVARKGSVVNRFYTGTVESLHHGDNQTVAALKRYHSKNYCAPRMTLIMTSNMSLSKQLEVAHKHFDAVPRGDDGCSATPQDFSAEKAFDAVDNVGRLIQLRSDSVPQLWMMFPLPPIQKAYKAQPASMLEYQLGYAGPKSLKSQLKSRGLISDLGLQVDQSSAATLVFVTFDLTSDGTKRVDELTSVVFKYLAKVRSQSAADVKSVYAAMQQMSRVTFDYQEAPDSVEDFVSNVAGNMMLFAPSDVLSGDTTIDEMDVDLVQQLLSKLTPDNVNLALASKDFEEKDSNQRNQYYNVKYAQNPIPEAWRKSWANSAAEDDMHAPPALKFVPANLALINDTAGEIPVKLEDKSSDVETWWLGRGLFPLPKAQLRVKLTVAKELFATPSLAALRKLHVELSNEGLEEPMEDLGVCGLSWDLKDSSEGYQLSMDGYSEHIAALVAEVADGIHKPPSDDARFLRAKQRLIVALEDTTAKMPYEHAMEALSVLSTNSVFSSQELIAALKATTLKDFNSYLSDLGTHGLRMQLLVTGNVKADAAKQLSSTLAKGLHASKVLTKAEAAKSRALRVDREVQVRMQNPIPKDSNNAVVNAYQFGVPDVADRVKLLMLGKMISQPAYDDLRTKQQLGYVVFAVMMPELSTLQLVMIVQGAKKAPDDIDGRIETTLANFAKTLGNLSASEFKGWKASLRSTLNEKDQNMAQEADRVWSQVVSDELCFNRKQMALDYLDSFESPSDLAVEFQKVLVQPRKVSVRLFGAQTPVNQTQAPLASSSNSSSLVAVRQKVVVFNDAHEDKLKVADSLDYWPAANICRIHQKA
jgi:insulysin